MCFSYQWLNLLEYIITIIIVIIIVIVIGIAIVVVVVVVGIAFCYCFSILIHPQLNSSLKSMLSRENYVHLGLNDVIARGLGGR